MDNKQDVERAEIAFRFRVSVEAKAKMRAADRRQFRCENDSTTRFK